MLNDASTLRAAARDFRCCWKSLALIDLLCKVVIFVLLAPLVGVMFRGLLAISGKEVLTDLDILGFFLGPAGWLCCIVVGGLSLAIVAIEQAALMAILAAHHEQRRISIRSALWFAWANALPVLRVAMRLTSFVLLTITPFLVVAGVVYFTLLTEYDISYYLKEKPTVFLVAIGIASVLAATASVVLLRLASGWFLALPLTLFDKVYPDKALRASGEKTRGCRLSLLSWIAAWMLTSILLFAVTTSIVVGLGRLVVPRATGSLWLLAISIGVTLILWGVVTLAVNLFSTISLSAIQFNVYLQLACARGSSQLAFLQETGNGEVFRITRTKFLVAIVVGVIVAGVIGVVVVRSVSVEDKVTIIAHRGASAAAPENTMAAVRLAIEEGADWIEIDVQETADGEVVVFHDSDFMRLASLDLKVWDATLADLKSIDIGSWYDPVFKDERVPLLKDVLAVCQGKVRVLIELKYYGHDKQLEQRVADIVEAQDMASEIALMSLEVNGVRKMKSLRPGWQVGQLMVVSVGDLTHVDADFLAVSASFADELLDRSAGAKGRTLYAWTVNDAATMSILIGRGVDGLITDKPALGRSVLAMRAQMSPVERLLLELAGVFGVAPEIGAP